MDNPVLIRVAALLDQTLRRAVVRDFRQDAPYRFRLVLAQGDDLRSLALSIHMERPWAGRPSGRQRSRPLAPGPFAARVARELRGTIVERVAKPQADRRLEVGFSDGHRLVAELVPRRPNLVLLDAQSRVLGSARHPRSARTRLQTGHHYEPDPMPSRLLDPFESEAELIEARIRDGLAQGRSVEEVLKRDVAGIGPVAAELLAREVRDLGGPAGEIVRQRLEALVAGRADPIIEAPSASPDELDAAARLLPWEPPWPAPEGWRRIRRDDAAATAGFYHESVERRAESIGVGEALVAILEREARRLRDVELRVAADVESFEDPERFRIWAEALLAGLGEARRAGEHILVPDPYDAQGRTLSVPTSPGESFTKTAERHFTRHRRALRGIERARARAVAVRERRLRLERLLDKPRDSSLASVEALQQAMQQEGIAVGLEHLTRAAKRGGRPKPRVEGVRLFRTVAGDTVMIGKSGPDNHRLTFKLAGPEDFWLHAQGVPGAHVILRNDARASRPHEGSLQEAAEAAAWFSEARTQPAVDVQWTRRKHVRKLRGASPGTVRVKKAATVRVRPCRPEALDLEP